MYYNYLDSREMTTRTILNFNFIVLQQNNQFYKSMNVNMN